MIPPEWVLKEELDFWDALMGNFCGFTIGTFQGLKVTIHTCISLTNHESLFPWSFLGQWNAHFIGLCVESNQAFQSQLDSGRGRWQLGKRNASERVLRGDSFNKKTARVDDPSDLITRVDCLRARKPRDRRSRVASSARAGSEPVARTDSYQQANSRRFIFQPNPWQLIFKNQ
jgi:hypothetical protein